ncbi:ABC transporter permease subunit [Halovenus sp. WSH3]|uniref:ABC transporter permease subunit n=1 Tax=Halovenus carboxidivorans TaxID=2692199 RepID=A0A6B0T5Y2_9EURY|nr:ABC transporter permease subunit [Halovenus carboxidivorans]MXR51596.1 ABC transporter permease subunit [Halovenus carboxidivorans]
MTDTPAVSPAQSVQSVAVRELFTVGRARSLLALFAGLVAVVVGIGVLGGAPRYLPTVADLLLPMELLVPTVAFALGYRPIASDAERGELAVLKTYPLRVRDYVFGVFLGRAIALVVMLLVPLVCLGGYLAVTSTETPSLLATQQGADSPIIYARFLLLTVLFGLTILALSLAVSAVARSRRTALVLAGAALLFVVVVVDLLILRGFAAGRIGSDLLLVVLAVSPTSAYRGLVFETALDTPGLAVAQASVPLSLAGLVLWLVGSLLVTAAALSRE